MYGSNTTAPLHTSYQVSKSTFGTHSSNKSSGMWLRRMASTFNSPEPIGLFSVLIHQTASVCNPSTSIAGTSKAYYGCLCQRVTCHVVQCAAGSAVPCPKSALLLKDTILSMTDR
ncbi:hypothetical protein AVEN_197984-1 [Araneus ventricosus]|uniref:Uncharacterized protein n=1 Tax=Araneus ventricosus TaxID=182803 RepID=A0A4Y2IBU0_ARAVE|nr:hypothetical protein AVEN_197984-1 [Araneus ventricosus]